MSDEEARGSSLPSRPRPHSIAPGQATVEDHLEMILRGVGPLGAYDQPIVEALGLALDEEVVSDTDLPRFDAADIDGFALSTTDVVFASASAPVTLPVVADLEPGTGKPFAISAGSAVRIAPGTPIPRGCDAVVPLEAVELADEKTIVVTRSVREGAGVRRRGDDVAADQVVLSQGSVLGPREIGLLAALGRARVRARPRPRVVVMSAGPELADQGTHLEHDAVYDSNSHMISAAARSAGALAYRVGVVSAEPEAFRRALSDQLVRADLVIIAGGIGHHRHDVVRRVLGELEGVSFSDVAIEPGGTQGFGRVFDEQTPVILLPGDPVSAAVGFEVFALPAIRRMMGLTPYRRPQVHAVLAKDIVSQAGVREYVRARFEVTHRGAKVTPIGIEGAHVLGALAAANALVVVGEDETALNLGDTVRTLVLDRSF